MKIQGVGEGLIKRVCHEQGSIAERSHWHTFVALHNIMFIRGDLPNRPIELYTGYTQKRRRAYWIEQTEQASGAKFWLLEAPQMERSALVSNQEATVAAHSWWTRSPLGLWVWPVVQPSLSMEWLQLWVLIAHNGRQSCSYQCPGGVLIQVSRLAVLHDLGPWGIPITPHYFNPGHHATWHNWNGWQWLHIGLSKVSKKSAPLLLYKKWNSNRSFFIYPHLRMCLLILERGEGREGGREKETDRQTGIDWLPLTGTFTLTGDRTTT